VTRRFFLAGQDFVFLEGAQLFDEMVPTRAALPVWVVDFEIQEGFLHFALLRPHAPPRRGRKL
jgi:hypothetical protein